MAQRPCLLFGSPQHRVKPGSGLNALKAPGKGATCHVNEAHLRPVTAMKYCLHMGKGSRISCSKLRSEWIRILCLPSNFMCNQWKKSQENRGGMKSWGDILAFLLVKNPENDVYVKGFKGQELLFRCSTSAFLNHNSSL